MSEPFKLFTVGPDGQLVEVDAAKVTAEWKEAERLAGPKEGSRDWLPCMCGRGLDAVRKISSPGGRVGEVWKCRDCGCSYMRPAEPRPLGGLSRFEWSLMRHHTCNVFWSGHSHCLADVWLDSIELFDGQLVSPVLGSIPLSAVVP